MIVKNKKQVFDLLTEYKYQHVTTTSRCCVVSIVEECQANEIAAMLRSLGVQFRIKKWDRNPLWYFIVTIGSHFSKDDMYRLAIGLKPLEESRKLRVRQALLLVLLITLVVLVFG